MLLTATQNKVKVQQLFRNEESYATSLLACCLDLYGTKIFEWEPETLWLNLAEDLDIELPDLAKDKIQSLITCYTTDLFYHSVEVFAAVANVLGGAEANFAVMDYVTPEEALWAMYEVTLNLAEDEKNNAEFNDEIKSFLGVVLKHDGMLEAPDMLAVADYEPPSDKEWADDPVMYNAVFDKKKTDKAHIMSFLAERLKGLIIELDSLPLTHRDAKQWETFKTNMMKSVAAITANSSNTRGAVPS